MKKRLYQIRPQAEADLDGHARTIVRDNLDAALRLYDLAEETYEMLGEMPYMGALHQTSKPELMGMRYAPIKEYSRYLVFYKPDDTSDDTGVDIVRVLHARMDRGGWL